MIKNYFIVAFRNLWRNKLYSLINILGLSVGLSASIIIMLYVYHEYSFDCFHDNKDRLYRVNYIAERKGNLEPSAIMVAAVGQSMLEEFPEIEDMTRFSTDRGGNISWNEKDVFIPEMLYTDSSFFNMFSFPLLQGYPEKALTEPYSIVLTESTARKIFDDKDPMGEVIRLNNNTGLKVTGVCQDVPSSSTIRFNALISFTTLYLDTNLYLGWDGGHAYYTYVMLKPGASMETLESRYGDFLEKHINYKYREYGVTMHLDLEPIAGVHLQPRTEENHTGLTNIIIFITISVFILILACINFTNLSTARSLKRLREVGIRKVVGAGKGQLIRQFIGESMLITILSLVIAIILTELFQPYFNNLTGVSINLYMLPPALLIPGLILLVLIVGLLAGSYPAFYLSGFQPVDIMKGGDKKGRSKYRFRNILIVLQFFISSALIINTLVVYRQIGYIKNKDLGYSKENVVVVPLVSEKSKDGFELLKNELRSIPEVISSGASSEVPGRSFMMNGYLPEGMEKPMLIHALDIDPDFLGTLDIPIIEGRNFNSRMETDREAFLINETLAKMLGWDDPVGKLITRDGRHPVIGVVRDFNFSTLHEDIKPLIITMKPWLGYDLLSVKINPVNRQETLNKIESLWNKMYPNEPFNYFFQEVHVNDAYGMERYFGEIFMHFSILAIFIACLGLFGLAAFTTEYRKKEIAVRKVLGASVQQIILGVSGDYLKWILLANILAIPAAYLFMENWLKRFAYAQPIGYIPFVITLILTIAIAWITILVLVNRLGRTNPAEVLKYE